MQIEHAQIPMGPESDGMVLELLQRTLDASAPNFPHLIRELACRVDRDLGRLPWTEGILAWLKTQSEAVYRVLAECLWDISTKDPSPEAARGATLILLALAEHTSGFDDKLLFDLAFHADSTEVTRMVGAYLLATVRTRSKALADLGNVAALSELVREQKDVEQGMRWWRALLDDIARNADTAHGEIVFSLIEERPELHFALRNGLLDVFDSLPSAEQQRLVRFMLNSVEAQPELVQLFVLDLLQYSPFLETARQVFGYQLDRQLRHLEQTAPSARIRNYVATLLTQWEISATSTMKAAARGDPKLVRVVESQSIAEAVRAAKEWFNAQDVTRMSTIPHNPKWGPEDYAFKALQLLGRERSLPVDLEFLCARLGCFLQAAHLPKGLDGLFIQRPGLPGPIILYNRAQSESRKRFTIAHELGHAIMPGHTRYLLHASRVSEPAEPRRLDETEKTVAATGLLPCVGSEWEADADRFAAFLLMPRRWFAEAVWRTPMTLEGLKALAAEFGVSVTAAAFQAIRLTREAVAVVYSEQGVVRFQRMTDDFRDRVGPSASVLDWVGAGTVAATLLQANQEGLTQEAVVPATAWLDRPQVAEIHEQSLVTHTDHVLSLLTPVGEE